MEDDSSNFTTLLQQGSQVSMENGSFDLLHDVTKSSSAEKRGKNFNSDEDKLLVSAWLNTSLDAADGNNMKGDHFWKRIESYYIQGKNVGWPARTRSSLNHRWGIIQHDVNKFCGFLTQVEALRRSGVSNEDNIQEARRWYLGIVKSAFRFDHCWVLLKDQEKWKSRDQLCGIKRKKSSTSSNYSTLETVNLGEECDDVNKENFNKRPGGRKAAKEKKRLLGDVSGFTTILCELKDEKQNSRVEKINLSIEQKSEFLQLQKSHLSEAREANRIQNEKLQMQSRIENEKLQLERDREDMNIMMKDLSSLDEEQKKYFQMRRMEILGRVNGMQVEL
ncbi:hypothetical protein OROMI_009144 [Orobanche minor]